MRIAVVGGGPAGFYFALLARKAFPDSSVELFERNPRGATYGWGVVFSDRTLTSFREADFKTYTLITDNFIIWDAIDVRYRDEVVRCGGQVFSGIARRTLLSILAARCEELGVVLNFEREMDPDSLEGYDLVVAADGVNSRIREKHIDAFKPRLSRGRSRYIWFGTERVFDSFTFCFRENDAGFFQAHAYPFDGTTSTFIPECDRATWERAGLNKASEAESIAYCEELFALDLNGRSLMSNNSKWIDFVTLKNKRWYHDNVVLVGDSAHTAHFSIGSGTKLAMEDSIALVQALETKPDIASALVEYELERKPRVERFQEAARQSQDLFENTSLYKHMEPLQFSFHLLSRSGRIDYDDLRLRDPLFVGDVDRGFAGSPSLMSPPPAFGAISIGSLRIANRVAAEAAPTYSASDGVVGADHLLAASRTGAGLVFTGPVAISAHGRATPGDPGLYEPGHVEAWRAALNAGRAKSDARIALTLNHSGPRGSCRERSRGADIALIDGEGWSPIAARAQTYSSRSVPAVAIDDQRRNEVLEDFVIATRFGREVGFDLLELQMGHGYLLGSFISPLTNDGDLLEFPLMVLDAVRAEWEGPLGVALNGHDWARGGADLEHAVNVAKAMKEHGCDVVRVLAGQTVARHTPRYDSYFLTHYAERIRVRAGIPTIATGDIPTVDRVNTLVAGGRADLCLLRPELRSRA